jgi:uncharacterized protein
MRSAWLPSLLLPILFTTSCTSGPSAADDYYGTNVYFPNGKQVLAEQARTETMMMRGMMFRDSLAENRGMLFTHGEEGTFSYWMFQVKIPLDIIWMDSRRRIVEIVENAQPCPQKPCVSYGGKEKALYVLELSGGNARKNGLKVGDVLRF